MGFENMPDYSYPQPEEFYEAENSEETGALKESSEILKSPELEAVEYLQFIGVLPVFEVHVPEIQAEGQIYNSAKHAILEDAENLVHQSMIEAVVNDSDLLCYIDTLQVAQKENDRETGIQALTDMNSAINAIQFNVVQKAEEMGARYYFNDPVELFSEEVDMLSMPISAYAGPIVYAEGGLGEITGAETAEDYVALIDTIKQSGFTVRDMQIIEGYNNGRKFHEEDQEMVDALMQDSRVQKFNKEIADKIEAHQRPIILDNIDNFFGNYYTSGDFEDLTTQQQQKLLSKKDAAVDRARNMSFLELKQYAIFVDYAQTAWTMRNDANTKIQEYIDANNEGGLASGYAYIKTPTKAGETGQWSHYVQSVMISPKEYMAHHENRRAEVYPNGELASEDRYNYEELLGPWDLTDQKGQGAGGVENQFYRAPIVVNKENEGQPTLPRNGAIDAFLEDLIAGEIPTEHQQNAASAELRYVLTSAPYKIAVGKEEAEMMALYMVDPTAPIRHEGPSFETVARGGGTALMYAAPVGWAWKTAGVGSVINKVGNVIKAQRVMQMEKLQQLSKMTRATRKHMTGVNALRAADVTIAGYETVTNLQEGNHGMAAVTGVMAGLGLMPQRHLEAAVTGTKQAVDDAIDNTAALIRGRNNGPQVVMAGNGRVPNGGLRRSAGAQKPPSVFGEDGKMYMSLTPFEIRGTVKKWAGAGRSKAYEVPDEEINKLRQNLKDNKAPDEGNDFQKKAYEFLGTDSDVEDAIKKEKRVINKDFVKNKKDAGTDKLDKSHFFDQEKYDKYQKEMNAVIAESQDLAIIFPTEITKSKLLKERRLKAIKVKNKEYGIDSDKQLTTEEAQGVFTDNEGFKKYEKRWNDEIVHTQMTHIKKFTEGYNKKQAQGAMEKTVIDVSEKVYRSKLGRVVIGGGAIATFGTAYMGGGVAAEYYGMDMYHKAYLDKGYNDFIETKMGLNISTEYKSHVDVFKEVNKQGNFGFTDKDLEIMQNTYFVIKGSPVTNNTEKKTGSITREQYEVYLGKWEKLITLEKELFKHYYEMVNSFDKRQDLLERQGWKELKQIDELKKGWLTDGGHNEYISNVKYMYDYVQKRRRVIGNALSEIQKTGKYYNQNYDIGHIKTIDDDNWSHGVAVAWSQNANNWIDVVCSNWWPGALIRNGFPDDMKGRRFEEKQENLTK